MLVWKYVDWENMLALLSTLCLGWSFSSQQKSEEECVCGMCLAGSSRRRGPGFLLLYPGREGGGSCPLGLGSRIRVSALPLFLPCPRPTPPALRSCRAPPWAAVPEVRGLFAGPGPGEAAGTGGRCGNGGCGLAARRRLGGGSPGLGVPWRRLLASGRRTGCAQLPSPLPRHCPQ